MEIGFFIDNVTDKEAGDIAMQVVEFIQELGYMVSDYFIEVQT